MPRLHTTFYIRPTHYILAKTEYDLRPPALTELGKTWQCEQICIKKSFGLTRQALRTQAICLRVALIRVSWYEDVTTDLRSVR